MKKTLTRSSEKMFLTSDMDNVPKRPYCHAIITCVIESIYVIMEVDIVHFFVMKHEMKLRQSSWKWVLSLKNVDYGRSYVNICLWWVSLVVFIWICTSWQQMFTLHYMKQQNTKPESWPFTVTRPQHCLFRTKLKLTVGKPHV